MRPAAPLLALNLAISVPALACAQTLEECLELARQHAPALRAAEAGVSRAEQAVREARAALRPSLRLGASLVQNSEPQRAVFPIPGAPAAPVIKLGSATAMDLRTDAQITLYSGGRDRALVRAAEAAGAGQVHGRAQAEADLVLRLSQAFYRALAAQRLEYAALEALTSARAHLGTSAARVRAGVAPRLDSLQARVDLGQRTAAWVRAAEAVQVAHTELETAIGAPLDSTRELVEPARQVRELPPAQEAVRQARGQRPELAAYDQALRENRLRLEAARAAHRPQVSLSATAQYLGPNRDEDYWDIDHPGLKTYKLFAAVGLSMPLFDGGLAEARAGEIAADGTALEARRRDAELAIRREVERALSDARVALTLWQSDSSRVAAAREAVRLAAASYKGGTATGTDVRDAEAALADARAEEAQSLMDYGIALASLDHAIGTTAR